MGAQGSDETRSRRRPAAPALTSRQPTLPEPRRIECRLDGAAFALCSSPKTYSGLSKATHQFEVRGVDAAGNADATPAVRGLENRHGGGRDGAVGGDGSEDGSTGDVTRPPLLVWRRASRARYYNVQV